MRGAWFTIGSMNTEPIFRADRLNDLMKERGLDPGKIEYLAEMSRSMVFYLQNGRKPNVSAVIVGKLAGVLGCSMEYLMGMTDQPYRYSEKTVPEIVPLYERLDPVQRWVLMYMARSMAATGMDEGDDAGLLDALVAYAGEKGDLRSALGSALNAGFTTDNGS